MAEEIKVFSLVSESSNSWKSDNPNSGCYETDKARTIDTKGGDPTCRQGGNVIVVPDKARALTARGDSSPCYDRGQNVIAVYDARGNGGGKTVSTITGDHENRITDYTAVCVEGEPAYCLDRASYNQGANAQFNISVQKEQAQTLVAKGPHAVAEHVKRLMMYIVRRLTPLECCRLQGFPDYWAQDLDTAQEELEQMEDRSMVKSLVALLTGRPKEPSTPTELDFWEGVFETHRLVTNPKGKPKTRSQVMAWLANPHSDSAEYKMWGNSLAIPNAYNVLAGIADELRAERQQENQNNEEETQ